MATEFKYYGYEWTPESSAIFGGGAEVMVFPGAGALAIFGEPEEMAATLALQNLTLKEIDEEAFLSAVTPTRLIGSIGRFLGSKFPRRETMVTLNSPLFDECLWRLFNGRVMLKPVVRAKIAATVGDDLDLLADASKRIKALAGVMVELVDDMVAEGNLSAAAEAKLVPLSAALKATGVVFPTAEDVGKLATREATVNNIIRGSYTDQLAAVVAAEEQIEADRLEKIAAMEEE